MPEVAKPAYLSRLRFRAEPEPRRHTTRSQPLYRRLDVFDLSRHLGVISRGGAGRLEERELPVAAAVKQAFPRSVRDLASPRRTTWPAVDPAPESSLRLRCLQALPASFALDS